MHCTVLFVCIALAAIGQAKSARVSDYLGKERFETEAPPAGVVKFVFQKAVLKRNSDGRTTYASLLKGDSYFTDDDNAGALKVVTLVQGGKEYMIGAETHKTATVSNDPVRPRVLTGEVAQPSAWAIPDSQAMADNLGRFKTGVETGAQKVGAASGVIWDTWMWVFKGYLLPGLLIIAVLLYFVSGVSASESLLSLRGHAVAGRAFIFTHSWSAFLLACDLGVIALTVLAHCMFYVWGSTHSIIALCLAGFGAGWLAKIIIARIVPNLPVAHTRSQAAYTNGNKQLPG